MEAEVIRDSLLYVSGNLDQTMSGPDIDNNLGLKSKRRSIYLRTAAEKEVEFLKIFDGAAVTECYQRRPSVMPQQALALANSELALAGAHLLAGKITSAVAEDNVQFVTRAFAQVLAREPTEPELRACLDFLQTKSEKTKPAGESALATVKLETGGSHGPVRTRENLILVLFNHNDFVAVR
jgi:hypothetical protein